jgi:hypothetical protein
MKTETLNKIISYISEQGPQRPADLVSKFKISPQALHAHLRKAIQNNTLQRIGHPPHTRYGLPLKPILAPELSFDLESEIDRGFSYLAPSGTMLFGREAFNAWVASKGLTKDYQSLARAYRDQRSAVYSSIASHPIDTLPRLRSILPDSQLDSAVISDFYAIPQFGKTTLGNLIHAVKTSFHQQLFDQMIALIEEDIRAVIKRLNIDAVLFVPHSIPRKRQFLPELRQRLCLPLPEIQTEKIFAGGIPVAQKSLSKINERIDNAASTIFLRSPAKSYHDVLIIDDAIGSGGTVNEIARKLKQRFQVKRCHAYAVVGSYKEFDVIAAV